MKKLLIGSVALVAIIAGVPAMAADLAVRASACKAPIAASVFNWTGCYVGGKAGGSWSKSNFTTTMDL